MNDLATMAVEQQKDLQATDSDQTPTEVSPPSTMSPQVCTSFGNDLDIHHYNDFVILTSLDMDNDLE